MKKKRRKNHTILGEYKFVIVQNIKNTKRKNVILLLSLYKTVKIPGLEGEEKYKKTKTIKNGQIKT